MMKIRKGFDQNYLLLLQGVGVSQFGDLLYSLAIAYAVYFQTGSTLLMASMASLSLVTRTVLLPFAGALVDRLNRKKIMIFMDLIRGILMLLMAYCAFFESLSIPMMILSSFVCASCQTFFSPAVNTSLVDLLHKDKLVQGQSIYNGMQSTINLVGNSISGAVIALFGVAPIILLNGCSFMLSALTECLIEVPIHPKEGRLSVKTLLVDVITGGRLAFTESPMNRLMVSSILLNILGSGIQTLLLPLALSKGLSIAEYGIFLSGISAVGILGSFIMGIFKIPSSIKFKFMVRMFMLSNLLIIVSMISLTKWIFVISFIFSTLVQIFANAVFNASFMMAIPIKNRGTIFGFMASCGSLGAALSAMFYGVLAESFSLTILCLMGSVLTILVLVWFNQAKDEAMTRLFESL